MGLDENHLQGNTMNRSRGVGSSVVERVYFTSVTGGGAFLQLA